MSPRYINPVQWQQSIGYARQACARLFRDGSTPADALAAFGLPGAEADLGLEHRGRAHRPCAVRARPAQGRLTQSRFQKAPNHFGLRPQPGAYFFGLLARTLDPSDGQRPAEQPGRATGIGPRVRLASHGLPGVRSKQSLGSARF